MRPAELLEGTKLPNGWVVTALLNRKPTATGGNFSTGYLVKNEDGREGFLKAMDYLAAMLQPNTAEVLQWMTEAYLFERKICESCRTSHLRRVVHAIDAGSVLPDTTNPFGKVEYLIFERADGDIRAHLDAQKLLDVAFALRVLHNVAVGIDQMHNASMAHQDLKPSNVLVFQGNSGSKVSDLGRAWAAELKSPFDDLPIAGDPGYAPPEQLYGAIPTDPLVRRFGCDVYHFGSMIAFIFARVHMNGLLAKHLPHIHRPSAWGGSYSEVLPYLKAAFADAVLELKPHIPLPLQPELIEMVRQLCEPDPAQRGHPANRALTTRRYSLERYVSRLDFLVRKAELELLGE